MLLLASKERVWQERAELTTTEDRIKKRIPQNILLIIRYFYLL